MKKERFSTLVLLMAMIMSFCGCNEEEMIQAIGGGSCLFVNHTTKDSVLVTGGINAGDWEKMDVHDGDMLELTFIPDHEFEKYNFTVTYTLMDGTQHSCTNHNYTYKFTVSDWGAQKGKISFLAKSTDKNINIATYGDIHVMLLESDPSDNEDDPSDNRTSVKLTYYFSCDSDLVRFVTPEIIYTDHTGEHSIILDENQWSPVTHVFCSYTENGETHYETFELKEGETVPNPWQIEESYSSFSWNQIAKLNEIGVINNCVVKYHRKPDYTIEKGNTYRLHRSLSCIDGFSVVNTGKGVNIHTFKPISIDIGGKYKWNDDEVEEYIDEICAKNDTVSIEIDAEGGFTLLSGE